MNLPDLRDDTVFFPMLQAVQECLCAELAAAGGPKLCFCGLTIGQPPFGLMDCGTQGCGIAWVSPVSSYPSSNFPTPSDASLATNCGTRLVMQIQVGVARCAPRPQGRATTVDPQDSFDAMRLYLSDMQAAKRALLCCFGKDSNVTVALENWTPIEPSGGVSGGIWVAYIGKA